MALYAGSFNWPPCIDFEIVGTPDSATTGSVEVVGNRYFLRPSQGFSFSTFASSERVLRTRVDGFPALLRGHIFVVDGAVGLRIDEAHLGTDDPEADFIAVEATFELLPSLCTWRHEDGAARSASTALALPEIAPSPAMSLVLGADGLAVVTAATATGLDNFDHHLAALQDLVCFAADRPAERLSLIAVAQAGTRVTILGRNRFPPFGSVVRQPVEYLLRFDAAYIQDVISSWWTGRTAVRPVHQVLAGLRYQPGWVETDVNILAACVELFGRVQFPSARSRRISVMDFAKIEDALNLLPGLNKSQRDFINFIRSSAGGRPQRLDESIDAIAADLGQTLSEAGINLTEWKSALIEARNGVSHAGGAGSLQDAELRAVKDATRVVLSLDILKHMNLPSAALARAAERLKVRHSVRHRGTATYRS
ncbi:hypothetical protein ITJ43_12020 [Microbacterium sp. VKM Ac-2870]|uniref:hypothetical protein n=1 Tax=Microbacterium sp. VKM Ac-2870 TaxID=2783825 RepID=UPI00188CD2EC|nr:hypothetical protein [Microbacterium sp. VKM Ac-2870]MBF4562862.1 hypothetical protein [Microbacterium sp. VKM Ac-2870]